MSASRRSVLKGIALGSVGMALGSMGGRVMGRPAGTLAGAAAVPAGEAAVWPLLALIDAAAAGSVFLDGAMAAHGARLQARKVARDPAFMLDLERRLRSGQPLRVIGLLEDASAVLVVDMGRSAGARLQWLGQHTAEVGFTRHHLLTTDIADGCSRQLALQLHACGAGFSLREERHDGSMLSRDLAGPARRGKQSAQWAASLGYLLASLGARPATAAPRVPATSVPSTGSFVSFSIES